MVIRTGFEPAITRLKASWLNHSPTGSWKLALRIGLEPTSLGSTIRCSAIELPQREMAGGRNATACRMSFTRRLLDGKPGHRLHAATPPLCTRALGCESRTTCTIRYLSRLTMRVYRIALPLFPTYRELRRPDLPGVTEYGVSAKRIAAPLSRRRRRLAAPGR